MSHLIDGYNLLHKLGVVPRDADPAAMERTRRRLLDLVAAAHGPEAPGVTVVFDARRLPRGVPAEQDHRGVRVHFAVGYAEADDLLEELIRGSPAPAAVRVVSDDNRVRRAARQRGCAVLTCGEYIDWLGGHRPAAAPPPAEEPAKPGPPTEEEAAYWRQAFADLENDPAMRELFDVPWTDEKGA